MHMRPFSRFALSVSGIAALVLAACQVPSLHLQARQGAALDTQGLLKPTEGMWLFTQPPRELLAQQGFTATKEWLEHVQKSCVRFPNGSGSFVSADGLVMTNHHVGRSAIDKLSTAERNLMEHGFYAPTRDAELKCQDLELMVLWKIEDVTDQIKSAAKDGMDAAGAEAARKVAITALTDAGKKSTGLDCEVVTLYQGGRYHLYQYKRFTDVRLVLAPEEGIAFFGGDPDNFEYPRYNLDCSFFRVYEDGVPYKPADYLKWSAQGAREDELVFVAGHPGSTRRMYTLDHLRHLRDVRYPKTLAAYWRREVQLSNFSDRSDEHARIARDGLFGVQNSRKAITGELSSLFDPEVMAGKERAEKSLRAFVDADASRRAQWGDGWDLVSKSVRNANELYTRYQAIGAANLGWGSRLMSFAVVITRGAEERTKMSTARLAEFADADLARIERQLLSKAPVYEALEINALESRLLQLGEWLGGDDPFVVKALGGKTPRARAEELVRGSKLFDPAERKRLWDGGKAAVDASREPLIELVRALDADSRAARKQWENEVDGPQKAGYAKIAEAKFAAYGESVYPDATFTLRLSFGNVKAYQEDGKRIAPFTDFAGLYQRWEERHKVDPFDLPPRWIERRAKVDGSVPFNFVCTADIIGGNSGSPTINKAGEVVGLIFDGNIHGL
ncbi:MAG: S46 family peptidase, partial [Planctomycetota bacterium]